MNYVLKRGFADVDNVKEGNYLNLGLGVGLKWWSELDLGTRS
jgi:hypothetical protein